MKQCHVYRLRGFGQPPVLVLQSEINEGTQVIVAPLEPVGRVKPEIWINPEITVSSDRYLVMLDHMTSLPRRDIGPEIASATGSRDLIMRGIDMLFSGF
jgi:hypothetical protein